MVMEQILCVYCGDFFDPSPRHKNQTACKKVKCQRAKKAAWQRHKLKTDPIYAANQKSSQQQWIKANAGYWKQYRKKNPQKAERNRIGQAMRNRKARSSWSVLAASSDCKDGRVKSQYHQDSNLLPVIAKMDWLADCIKHC
jgi:hypothetical protein